MSRSPFVVLFLFLLLLSSECSERPSLKAGDPAIKVSREQPLIIKRKLTADDPPDRLVKKSPCQAHRVTLEGKQKYQISIRSNDFDPILRLEDAHGKHLAHAGGEGEGIAQMVGGYKNTAAYRIIVTADPKGKNHGAYVLTIRSLDAAALARYRAEQRVVVMNNEVVRRLRQGRWKECLPFAKKVVELSKGLFGKDHLNNAIPLENLASVHKSFGQLGRAMALLQETKELYEKHDAATRRGYANCLNSIAGLYWVQGRYKRSLAAYHSALDIRKKIYGEYHLIYAATLCNVAVVYGEMGRFKEAVAYSRKAMVIRRKLVGRRHQDYAHSLNNLASLYQNMGQYDKSLPLLQQSWKIMGQLNVQHPGYTAILHNLAAFHQEIGQHENALPLLEKVLKIRKEQFGDDDLGLAVTLNNIASLYQDIGQYEMARAYYMQALQIREILGKDHPDYAQSLNNLATLFIEMGQYRQAVKHCAEIVQIYRKLGNHHPSFALGLNNLATARKELGQYREAVALYQRAIQIYREVDEHHRALNVTMNNLAVLYVRMGKYTQAISIHKEVLKRADEMGESHADYRHNLINLAAAYEHSGDFKRALVLYRRAQKIDGHVERSDPEQSVLLFNMAALHQKMNQPTLAVDRAHEALDIHHRFIESAFDCLTHQERIRMLGNIKDALHGYLSLAQQSNVPCNEIYQRLLCWKGRATARHGEEFEGRSRPELQPLLEKIDLLRASFVRQFEINPPSPIERIAWRQRAARIQKDLDDAEFQLARSSQTFQSYRKLRIANVEELQKALRANAALVDFLFYTNFQLNNEKKGVWKTERRLVAFVLRRNRDPILVNLGPSEAIKKLIQQWRQAVIANKSETAIGKKLGDKLWQPLQKHLNGIDMVLIAPDAELCQLPFAALPGQKVGTYLLEEKAIGYVISARHLLELKADIARPKARGLLAVGGLKFSDKTGKNETAFGPAAHTWKNLPAAAREVDYVQKLFAKQRPDEPLRLLAGEDANAAAFRKHFTAGKSQRLWKYLHLATHGWYDPPKALPKRQQFAGPVSFIQERKRVFVNRHPLLRCSLVLGGANANPDEGFLYGHEIEKLDLRGVDLVVLSACGTGLGKTTHGEGALGLQMAFHMAGARTQIASLWSVHDGATAVLMEEFYNNLWTKKLSKLESLRQAQLTVLRHPERVQQYNKRLYQELVKRGVPEAVLAERGIGKVAVDLPAGSAQARRSPPALWAAFVLSGDNE